MPIQVTCPGCLKRFQVSDKFAGQKGPCPNCKTVIQIPKKEDEVVIHGGEEFDFAGKDARGKAIGKPILREQTVVKPGLAAAVAAGVVVVFVSAAMLGRSGLFRDSLLTCGVGLLIVSPALTVGGYKFLYHSEELLPYRGKPLWLRAAICAVLYVALWGFFEYLASRFLSGELWEWMVLVAPFLCGGAFLGLICFDLDFGGGFLHYSFYVAVIIVLRYVAGLGWIWDIAREAAR